MNHPQNGSISVLRPSVELTMVIGLGLFRQKALLIDYQHRLFSVADRLDDFNIDRQQWLALPLTLTHEGIIIEAMKNNETFNMLLDTGASHSMLWSKRLNRTENVYPCKEVIDELDYEGCRATQIKIKSAPSGQINIEAVLVDNVDSQMEAEGLLGTNFLQHHRVIIDFPAQKLLMRANEPG